MCITEKIDYIRAHYNIFLYQLINSFFTEASIIREIISTIDISRVITNFVSIVIKLRESPNCQIPE